MKVITSSGSVDPISLGSVESLRRCALGCRNCPLWEHATQTVFGDGCQHARVMLVGEQPGSQEDIAGKPFVGPAGKLLHRAMMEAGLDESETWITNAVKHFKWKPRGKVRLHQKPSAGEIDACRPWLLAELQMIAPEVLVIMGATAARSLLGSGIKVTRDRGLLRQSSLAAKVILTVHPSSLLRRLPAPDPQDYERFVADLSLAKAVNAR